MAHPTKINYALAATLLLGGQTYAEIAPQVGAKSGETLRAGLSRKGVTATKVRATPITPEREPNVILRVAEQAKRQIEKDMRQYNDRTRAALSKAVADASEIVNEIKTKRNLKGVKEFGEAIEPLVRSAKVLHDWGNDKPIGLIALGVVEKVIDQSPLPAIDVVTTQVASTETDKLDNVQANQS